jgi:hypothetical protein
VPYRHRLHLSILQQHLTAINMDVPFFSLALPNVAMETRKSASILSLARSAPCGNGSEKPYSLTI